VKRSICGGRSSTCEEKAEKGTSGRRSWWWLVAVLLLDVLDVLDVMYSCSYSTSTYQRPMSAGSSRRARRPARRPSGCGPYRRNCHVGRAERGLQRVVPIGDGKPERTGLPRSIIDVELRVPSRTAGTHAREHAAVRGQRHSTRGARPSAFGPCPARSSARSRARSACRSWMAGGLSANIGIAARSRKCMLACRMIETPVRPCRGACSSP